MRFVHQLGGDPGVQGGGGGQGKRMIEGDATCWWETWGEGHLTETKKTEKTEEKTVKTKQKLRAERKKLKKTPKTQKTHKQKTRTTKKIYTKKYRLVFGGGEM